MKRQVLPQTRFISAFLLFVFLLSPGLIWAFESGSDNSYFYYADGKRIYLHLSKERVAVRFKSRVAQEAVEQRLAIDPVLSKFSLIERLPRLNLSIFKSKEEITPSLVKSNLRELHLLEEVEFASPIFESPDAQLIVTDEFIVQLEEAYDESYLNLLNIWHDVVIVRRNKKLKNTFILKIKKDDPLAVIPMANLYHEHPIIKFSQPNFIRKLKEQTIPNDAYFPNQ